MGAGIATQIATPIAAGAPPRQDAGPGAEAADMTMLMCDIVASTRLSMALNNDDYINVITEFYRICEITLKIRHGKLFQYIGDGILAVFDRHDSSPRKQARQAVQAAIALQNIFSEQSLPTQQSGRVKLQIRITITSGSGVRMCLGQSLGLKQETVFGQLPILAERLKTHTESGAIVISNQTARLTRTIFNLHNLGILNLKGFNQSCTAWRVLH